MNVTDITVLCNDDYLPWKPVYALYEHQIEFNYLETDLLEKCCLVGDTMQIAKQKYRVLLVEDGLLINQAQQAVVDQFRAAGGIVISVTDFCDADVINILLQYNPTALKPVEHPKDLRITHVIKDDMHFFMMINESDTSIAFDAVTTLSGKRELWNPWEGIFTKLAEGDKISVKLDAYEALILAVEA